MAGVHEFEKFTLSLVLFLPTPVALDSGPGVYVLPHEFFVLVFEYTVLVFQPVEATVGILKIQSVSI